MKQSKIAEQLARRAHLGQFRRDGVTPYITHPARVAGMLIGREEPDDVVAVGWLHDVLEDTDVCRLDAYGAYGVSLSVTKAVEILTFRPPCSYEKYLQSVKADPVAKKVKIADMIDNLCDHPTQKQIHKYCKGLLFLLTEETK